MDYCVITFASTHGAIYTQRLLKDQVPFLVMPVLREISKGCGISVRVSPEALETVQALLASSQLSQGEYAFYGITGQGASLQARPIP